MVVAMLAQYFALLMGLVLMVEGAWGFASPVVFGAFDTNTLHAGIAVALGVAGLWVALRGGARFYCAVFGVVMLTLGLFRLEPHFDALANVIFAMNEIEAVLSVVIGAAALGIYRISQDEQRALSPFPRRLRMNYERPPLSMMPSKPGHASPL